MTQTVQLTTRLKVMPEIVRRELLFVELLIHSAETSCRCLAQAFAEKKKSHPCAFCFRFAGFQFFFGQMVNQVKKVKPRADRAGLPVPLFLFFAFALGVGTTWLLMRGSSSAPPQAVIENFLPSPTSQPNETPISANQNGPPDVTSLSPAEAARTLANWNYDRQDWSHAIEHYQDAIARGADNADVRTDLGNCYRFLDQPQKALEQYQLAQKQNPLHENSLFNQISLFAQLFHDETRAEAAARDFLTRFPLSPQAPAAKALLSKAEGTDAGKGHPK